MSAIWRFHSLDIRNGAFEYLGSGVSRGPFHRCDTEHFGLPPPNFPLLQEVEADIGKHEEMWSLYTEFTEGLDKLNKEDWISFR